MMNSPYYFGPPVLGDPVFQILRAVGTYYFLYVEFSDFYDNQSLAGQTILLHYYYNLFQNQKSTNTAFYLENTTDNVANFCF
jgi:hypothetical protein